MLSIDKSIDRVSRDGQRVIRFAELTELCRTGSFCQHQHRYNHENLNQGGLWTAEAENVTAACELALHTLLGVCSSSQ